MSQYLNYLVCYDIENNKKRAKLFKDLKSLGLYPIQKSVFFGQLNRAELNSLSRLAKKDLHSAEDRCFWIQTKLDESHLKNAVGYEYLRIIDADGSLTL
jgi:CRISPR-associated protein Cas2